MESLEIDEGGVVDLSGQTALITGGAVRIGRELSLRMAREGVRVCVHYGHSEAAATEIVNEICAGGGEAIAVRADLNEGPSAAQHVFDIARSQWGEVDILINNAAIFESGRLLETTPDQWQRHLDINLATPLWMCQQLAAQPKNEGIRNIVNIVDWRATTPPVGHLVYTISKCGLSCLTKILAQELAPHIRVNAIAPGAILPPPGGDEESWQALRQQIPLQRTGSPPDIADALVFLLKSEFMTGEIIHVTGGQHLQRPSSQS